MKHIWTVLCQNSIVDQETQNLSLINVLESIRFVMQADVVTAIPFQGTIVTFWVRNEIDKAERGKVRVNIISPDGKVFKGDGIEIDLTNFVRLRFIYQIRGMHYTENGIYNFVIQSLNEKTEKWKTVTSIPLELIRVLSVEDLG